MVAAHLRKQNGIYQMILSYYDNNGKRRTKSISTHLPVKGNKRKAEEMLRITRQEFVPPAAYEKAGQGKKQRKGNCLSASRETSLWFPHRLRIKK